MKNRIKDSETDGVMFDVEGMSCMSCVARIETALANLPGFKSLRADLSTGRVEVFYLTQELGISALKAAISAAGYSAAPIADGPHGPSRLEKQRINPRPYYYGLLAAFGAVAFYLSLITLTSDWESAKMQYVAYGWWVIALAVGLGVQLTIFITMRRRINSAELRPVRSSVAASGGMSTVAMAACCSHYLGLLLPVMGLPFLAAFASGLAEYQAQFFLAGVIFNLIGIGVLIRQYKKHLIPVSAVLG